MRYSNTFSFILLCSIVVNSVRKSYEDKTTAEHLRHYLLVNMRVCLCNIQAEERVFLRDEVGRLWAEF